MIHAGLVRGDGMEGHVYESVNHGAWEEVGVGFSVPSVAVVGWQVTCAIGWPGPGPATGPDLAIAWLCHCIGGKAPSH